MMSRKVFCMSCFLLFCSSLKADQIKKMVLSNGLTVYLLEDKDLPYIHVELLSPMGSSKDPKKKEGLSHITAHSLSRKASNMTAQEISKKLETLGTDFYSSVSKDYAHFSVDSLSWNAQALLSLFARIISEPEFNEEETAFIKHRTLSAIEKLPESPSAFADRVFQNKIFRNTPYTHPSSGWKKTIEDLNVRDISQHYQTFFAPEHSLLGITGKYPQNIKKHLEAAFSRWKRRSPKQKKEWFSTLGQLFKSKKTQRDQPSISQKNFEEKGKENKNLEKYIIVHKKGQTQSQIRLGFLSLPRSSKDYLAFQIANIVLGGASTSKLYMEVREKHGLTYHVRSNLSSLMEAGVFSIRSPTRLSVTREALDRILDTLERFNQSSLTEKEFEDAKRYYKMQILKSTETAESQLSRFMALKYMGVPYDLKELDRNLMKLKFKEVKSTAKKYFSHHNVRIIIFSDKDQVDSQFKDLKPSIHDFETFL